MANHHLRNKTLSLKAKGLLSLMLSLPEDWDYTTRGLSCICKDGVDSIRVGIQELEANGYLVRERHRNENGQYGAIEYTILEKPRQVAIPPPVQEKPILEMAAKTIAQLMEEARIRAGAQNYKGYDYMDLARFDENTRHMIIFHVLTHDSPVGDKGDKMRLYLSDKGYQKALENAQSGNIRILSHAKVVQGNLRYDRKDQIR